MTIGPDAFGKWEWIGEDGGTPVGRISLTITEQDRQHGIGSIGYAVGEAHRRRGYASGMVRALTAIAFDPEQCDLDRLQAVAAVDNIGSRKVLEGAGFTLEGIQRKLLIIHGERIDHAAYALLREEWKERQ
jgi:ribosomal-protein-alanine N-acetyltransferase